MKFLISNSNKYSNISLILTILFSLVSAISFYISKSIIWIPCMLTIVLSILAAVFGIEELIKQLSVDIMPRSLIKSLLIYLTISLAISSIFGLVLFFNAFYFRDISLKFIPILIFSFVFTGTSISLFQRQSSPAK